VSEASRELEISYSPGLEGWLDEQRVSLAFAARTIAPRIGTVTAQGPQHDAQSPPSRVRLTGLCRSSALEQAH